MEKLKKFIPFTIIILLSFWAIKPFFNNGFFPMHDDTQVARVFEMKKALGDGMFPVRWAPDLGYGYGYPIFNFYAPLAYYVGGFINLIGFNSLTATKIMMAMGVLLSGAGMYLFARKFWGEVGGVISGILYLYAPYHALDIYVRGDVAEFWAYAFIPFIFYSVFNVYESLGRYVKLKEKFKPRSKIKRTLWLWISSSALAYAGLILSHNLTAMMVTPGIFIFTTILYVSHRVNAEIYKPYFIFLGLLLGVALAAFYWIPVFPEINYTNVFSVVGGGSDYKDHFVCIKQLWSSPWGYGGSVPGCLDGLSFRIGKIHLLMSLFSVFGLTVFYKKDRTKFAVLVSFFIGLLLSIFLTLKESKFIWDAIPHMAFFQFPWRFILLVSFLASFLGGAISILFEQKNKLVSVLVSGVVIGIVLFYNTKFFIPQKILNARSDDYTSKYALHWTVSKISDEYMPKSFAIPLYDGAVPNKRFNSNKDIKILSSREKTQSISAVIISKKRNDLYVNLAYFPGWHVFVDNNQIYFKYSGDGIIIPVPSGKHKIAIKFIQTPVEKLGNSISLIGVIIIVIGIITRRKYNG